METKKLDIVELADLHGLLSQAFAALKAGENAHAEMDLESALDMLQEMIEELAKNDPLC